MVQTPNSNSKCLNPLDINFGINGTVNNGYVSPVTGDLLHQALMLTRPLGLEKELIENPHRVVLSTAVIYPPSWLSASQAVDAPVNHLLL